MQSFILLDRSGSMASRWTEAVSSVNAYARSLIGVEGDFSVTVATFDSTTIWEQPKLNLNIPNLQPENTLVGSTTPVARGLNIPSARPKQVSTFDIIRNNVPVNKWNDIHASEVTPRGGTPLYDATAKLVNLVMSFNTEKAVLVFMTDGEENSSSEIRDNNTAKAMLDECRGKGWQVVFLGADFDNVKQAQSMGVSYDNSISTRGVKGLYNATVETASLAAGYAKSGTSMNYSAASRVRAASDSVEKPDSGLTQKAKSATT